MERKRAQRYSGPVDKERIKTNVSQFPAPERHIRYTFANILTNAISDNDFTQKSLSQKVHLSEGAISNYCNGRNIPNAVEMEKIANALGVSIPYLLGITKTKQFDEKISAISHYTGLSEESIANLHQLSNDKHIEANLAIDILNQLLENASFIRLLVELADTRNELTEHLNNESIPDLVDHTARVAVRLSMDNSIKKYKEENKGASRMTNNFHLLYGENYIEYLRQRYMQSFSLIADNLTRYTECADMWKRKTTIDEGDEYQNIMSEDECY